MSSTHNTFAQPGSTPNQIQSASPVDVHPDSSSQHARFDAHGIISTARAPSSCGNSLSSRSVSPRGRRGGIMSASEQWRTVRTLPTWVQRREDDEEDGLIPFPAKTHRRPPERSVHDAQREAVPVTQSYNARQQTNVWRSYVESSALYPPNTSHSEKVDLSDQGDLSSPWLSSTRDHENSGDLADDQETLFVSKRKRRIWYKRIHIILLNSPMVPLCFRAIIWLLSLLALALAGSIFQMSRSYEIEQKPSTVMAIVVDAIALVYLIYITFDEYSGKPLGLRSPKAKMRLIMFDLLFIIFDSANLSLAFDTLLDTRFNCVRGDMHIWNTRTVGPICNRQRALAAFLFLALCAWVSTFMVSVFRVVERVASSRT